MACENLVAACFAGDRAPFAAYESDQLAAIDYLKCCVQKNLKWSDVEAQLRAYLATKGSSEHYKEWVETQVRRAQQLFLPWLETLEADTSKVVDIR